MSDVRARPAFGLTLPLLALAFAAAHLTFEHYTGGVPSHHLLARPDLPEISNWFGLITLPLLGCALALRVQRQPVSASRAAIPKAMLPAMLGAMLYGGALAASFEFGMSNITNVLFFGLFAAALVFPVYRLEYILGFVVGMSFTFGGVLPLLIASVFASISFVLRWAIGAVVRMWRKRYAHSPLA